MTNRNPPPIQVGEDVNASQLYPQLTALIIGLNNSKVVYFYSVTKLCNKAFNEKDAEICMDRRIIINGFNPLGERETDRLS